MSLKVDTSTPAISTNRKSSLAKSHGKANSTTANVGNGVLKNIKNFVSSVVTPVGNAVAVAGINYLNNNLRKEDENFLLQLTGCDISLILKQVAPELPILIQNFLKDGFAHQFSQNEVAATEKLGEFVMIRLIANVASWHYKKAAEEFRAGKPIQRVVTINEFLVAVTEDMLDLFGKELNSVDAAVTNGAEISPELFETLAEKLLERIWPQENDSSSSIAAGLKKGIFEYCNLQKMLSQYLSQIYMPFGKWLSGKDFTFSQSGDLGNFTPSLEKLSAYTADCMALHFTKEDSATLQKLTGVTHVHELVEVISPMLLDGLLEFDATGMAKRNKDTVGRVCTSVILKLIANVSADVFKKELASGTEVKVDDFILRICVGVSDIFGTHLQKIKQHPANLPLEDRLFQPLAKHLLEIILPKNSNIHSFLARRNERLTKDLCIILKKSYESIALRNDAEEYKQRLREILWTPDEYDNPTDEPLPEIPTEELAAEYGIEKVVQQLYNACFNITDIGRGFVAEKFSNPSVVIDQMQETFNPKLSDELLEELVEAIFNYSDKEGGIEDSQSLYLHLKDIFSSFDLSDKTLREIADYTFSTIEEHQIDEEELKDLLKTEFNKENIPSHLFTGIAGGISKLIQLNHKINDKKMIVDHLKKIFSPAILNDSSIDQIAEEILKLIHSNKKIDSSSVIEQELLQNNQLALLSKTILSDVAVKVFSLINPNNPLKWLTPTIQNALHVTLFKALVHLLEKVDKKDRTPLQNLFPAALQILLDVGAEELPIIVAGIKNIANPNYQLLMAPFVNKIIHIFFEDDDDGATLEDHLPIPDEFKPVVAKKLRENAYKLILPIIEATTSWIDAIDTNRKRLDATYGNKHASEACRMVGAFAAQSIPYHLQESHRIFAQMALDNYNSLLVSPNGKVPSKKMRKLRRMIDYTMESIAKNDTPSMKRTFSFIQSFCEAALLRCFADLSECLDRLDQNSKNDPDGTLLVQGTTILLGELKDHLALIASVKEELKEYKAGQIPLDIMVQKFKDAGVLHSALADKSGKQRDLFFQNFAEKLFDIVGVNKDAKLPLPQFLKNPLWNMFEKSLMPLILFKLFEKVKDPHTLNLILINLFEQINADSDDVDVSSDDDIRKYNDAPQYKLEKNCGELTEALVQMQPSAITRWAIKKPKVRDLAAQAMGQPLRDILQAKSMKEIIDDLIESLIRNLHPGHWSVQSGTYICEKNGAIIADPDFSHILPRTKGAKKTYYREQKKAEKIAKEKMVEEITLTIENQTHYIFLGFFRRLWRKFRELINVIIDKTCGTGAKRIKNRMSLFLDGTAHYFIKPALMLTTYPILLAVKKLLRFYFVNKSTAFASDVYHDIHPNVLLKVIQNIMTFIGNAKSSQDISQDDSQSISLSSSIFST